MAIQTTSNLTNSIRTQYVGRYMRGAMANRLYDQFAIPYTAFAPGMSMSELMAGLSVQVNFLSALTPGTTAISETADVTPQTLRDATASVTPTSRGEALQWSEKLSMQQYLDLDAARFEKLGENQAYSVDLLAQAAALQGTLVYRAAARASLDAGTAGNRASDALFARMQGYLQDLRVPSFITPEGGSQVWMALMHPYPFHDIRESGNVDSIGLYQNEGLHLNFELGQIGPFRLVVNGWAKVFYGAGADNTSNVATTLSADANALATTFTVASASNIAAGDWLAIGTEETANTHYGDNEKVYVTDVSSTTITILSGGDNGGLKYDHASGVSVRNADDVFPISMGGPESLVKIYAEDIGEFGEVVGPEEAGILKQFTHVGWKWYGGYGRIVDSRILRVEVSSSYDA